MESDNSIFEGLEEKRKKICVAAIDTFQEKNFSQATVSEIASKAKVGKGTFYLYFENKLALLDFLLEYGTKKLIEYVKSFVDNEKDPEKKLDQLIDAQLSFFDNYRDFFSFFVREMWVHREGLEEQIYKLKDEYIVVIEEIIEEGSQKGIFKNVDKETISSGLFGMLSISSFHWIIFFDKYPKEKINKDIKEVFLDGLLKKE
ncbi:MAG: TetR/AcrR family transcriptional regulator [Bacillota bacterium]